MEIATSDLGTSIDYGGRPAVRFVRAFAHPIERLWSCISEPAELASWFPSKVQIDPRVGGAVQFSGDPHLASTSGTVLVYDPPRELAFTWDADELHFALEATESGCVLTLINVLSDPEAAARNAGGWTACLDELRKLVDLGRSDGPHSEAALPFRPLYDAHVAAGLPHGAAIPPGV